MTDPPSIFIADTGYDAWRESMVAEKERELGPAVAEFNLSKAERRARDEREAMERFRREIGPVLVSDFLAGVGRRDLSRRYAVHGGVVNRMIREGTTEDQRHRVWCQHQSRRQKAHEDRKRKG